MNDAKFFCTPDVAYLFGFVYESKMFVGIKFASTSKSHSIRVFSILKSCAFFLVNLHATVISGDLEQEQSTWSFEHVTSEQICEDCLLKFRHEYRFSQRETHVLQVYSWASYLPAKDIVQIFHGPRYVVFSDGKRVLVGDKKRLKPPMNLGNSLLGGWSRQAFSPDLRYSVFIWDPLSVGAFPDPIRLHLVDWNTVDDVGAEGSPNTVIYPISHPKESDIANYVGNTVTLNPQWDMDNRHLVFLSHDRHDVYSVAVVPLWASVDEPDRWVCYISFAEYILRPEGTPNQYAKVEEFVLENNVVKITTKNIRGVRGRYTINLSNFVDSHDVSDRCIRYR